MSGFRRSWYVKIFLRQMSAISPKGSRMEGPTFSPPGGEGEDLLSHLRAGGGNFLISLTGPPPPLLGRQRF